MRYHPDYELEMTKDEERYLEGLKKFDILKENADKISHLIGSVISGNFCHCALIDGVLELEIRVCDKSFKHTNSLSNADNLSNLSDWITSLSDFSAGKSVSWRNHFNSALDLLYKSYSYLLK